MTIIAFIGALIAAAYIVAVIEQWVTSGRFEPGSPLSAAAALVGRESIVPRRPDRVLYEIAPPLLLIASTLAAAVLPLAPGAIVTDLATGALYVNAVLAYVMIALVMAGWGPNGAYALVAGWRFLGQIVAYSMLVVMPIVGVGMRAESLSNTEVVRSQEPLWNAFYQPIGFVVFVFAAMAMTFLPPFDLPTAPSELAGGVAGEYTGVRLAVFRLGRLILVATVATAITVFYLGGWLGPVLPDWLWSALKTLAVIAIMLIGGRHLPRIREADLLAWSWKIGIPLALANIAIIGVIIVAVD